MTAHRVRFGCRRVLTVMAIAGAVVAATALPAAADPDVGDIESKIEDQAADLEGVIEDYNGAKEDLDKTKDEISDLEKKLAPYEKKLKKLYDKAEPMVTTAYESQNLNGATAVLNAGSPEAFTERMTALNSATSTDSAVVGKINKAKAKYSDDKDALDDLKSDQSSQESDLKSKKDSIQKDIDRLQDDRKDAYRDDADARGQSIDYIPEYVPGDRGVVVRHAMDQLGDPYVWAAAGPDSYDCSGLILDSYKQVGIDLPHQASQQYNKGTRISRDDLQPGDSVYYNGLEHVAMYLGDGYVIHAPTSGDVVKIQKLDEAATPYYGATSFI